MKIIHLDGFSEEERASYKTAISNNVLTAIRTLIHQCSKFNYTLSKANEVCIYWHTFVCLFVVCLGLS